MPSAFNFGGAAGRASNNYALAAGSIAGATSVDIDHLPTSMLSGGTFVAIGALTTKCEIRRVTAISGKTLTVGALAYAHSSGEYVFVLNSRDAPLEWFGCTPDDASIDSSAGLQQAYHDCAFNPGYGLTGHARRYYHASPLVMYDGQYLDRIALRVLSPFSIDPTIGLRNGEPDQFAHTLAGQVGTVTSVDTAANTITLSVNAGSLVVGDRLIFYPLQGATLPAPLEAGRAYYMLTKPLSNTWTMSLDRGGTTLDITTAGSGTIVAYSTGFARMNWNVVTFDGIGLRALNGLFALLQQPSIAISLKCENFAGPKGQAVLGGQHGTLYNPMFTDGLVGLNLQGMQMLYIYGASFEDCDVLMRADTVDQYGGAGGSVRNNELIGAHWESPGIHTAIVQTIMGSALVSAGTFTLSFGGQTTSAIQFNASAADIQSALEALSTVDPGDVTVTQEVGLLSAGGRMRLTFAGQYAWTSLSGTFRTTIATGSLTGGVYSMNYVNPDGRCVSLLAGVGTRISGSEVASGNTKPDGTGIDFLTVESAASITTGYTIAGAFATGQTANAINDLLHGFTVPWADTTGTSENLEYFSMGGYHGGNVVNNWWLGGRAGQYARWDSGSAPSFQVGGGATLKLGAGTPVKALSTGATSVADGGTVTHALGATPDVVQVTPSVSGEFVSVTAKDATTFTCAIKKHDGTAGTTQTVYWAARDI